MHDYNLNSTQLHIINAQATCVTTTNYKFLTAFRYGLPSNDEQLETYLAHWFRKLARLPR